MDSDSDGGTTRTTGTNGNDGNDGNEGSDWNVYWILNANGDIVPAAATNGSDSALRKRTG